MSRQEILDRIREKIKEEKKGQGKHSYIKIIIKKNCNLNKNNSYSRIHSNPVDRNRFLSIQKLCLASFYIQLSTNIKIVQS